MTTAACLIYRSPRSISRFTSARLSDGSPAPLRWISNSPMFHADGGRVGAVALEKSRHASIRMTARSSGLAPFVPTPRRFQAGKVRSGTRLFRHSPAVAGLSALVSSKSSEMDSCVFRGRRPHARRSEYRKPRLSRKGSGGSATSPKMSSLSARPFQNCIGPVRDLSSGNVISDEFQITLLARLQFRVQLDRLVHFA